MNRTEMTALPLAAFVSDLHQRQKWEVRLEQLANLQKRRSASRSGGLSEPEYHKRSYANAASSTLVPRMSMHLETDAKERK